jgi:uncharacterized protein (DUF58 family)
VSGLRGALRERLRPPRGLQVTTAGKWFLALTLGVGAAAVNTGNNLLYLAFSMNLSLIIVSGLLSEWTLRGVSVQAGHASEAFAGKNSLLALTCSASGKRFPAMAVTAAAAVAGGGGPVRFPDIPAGRSVTRLVTFRPSRRGPVPAFPCTVSTRFPFALFEKSLRVEIPAGRLIVYPEPGPPGKEGGDGAGDTRDGGAAPAGRKGPLPRGAREHMPADPVRDIHWKASAKAGKWMVKEREAEPARIPDIRIPACGPGEELERRLSRACGRILLLEREGRPYRLWLGGRLSVEASHPDRRRRALSLLALADGEGP